MAPRAAAAERGSKLQDICRKTRLCKFYATGSCTRGAACSFAHCADELKACPDLSCTKLCPALVSTGFCGSPACKFAHDKADLRCALARMSARQGSGGAECGAEAAPPARWAEPEGAATGGRGGRPCGGLTARAAAAAVAPPPASALGLPPAPPEAPRARALAGPPGARRGAPPPAAAAAPGAPASLEGARANPERRVRFHRTKLCQYFLHGRCSKRETCDFAHGEAELQARRAAARGAGRRGDVTVGCAAAAAAARPDRGGGARGGGGPLGAPAGEEVLLRTPSDETMCSFLTASSFHRASTNASTVVRSSSPGSSSDSAAWPEPPPEPLPQAPAEEQPGALAPPPWRSLPHWSLEAASLAPLAWSASEDEDVKGRVGGEAEFVTTVKNTFITVYMGLGEGGDARRRSKSATSALSRGRSAEP